MPETVTYTTRHGRFTMLKTEEFIQQHFAAGGHWDEETLDGVLPLIPRDKDVIEVGAHVGTHTVPYARACRVIHAFEPQRILADLLCKNLIDNGIANTIVNQIAVGHINGAAKMNRLCSDGSSVMVDYDRLGNWGGVTIGVGGEDVTMVALDSLHIPNVGFIHADCEGSEPLVFWGARHVIERFRPIIHWEDNRGTNKAADVQAALNVPDEIMNFDIRAFCESIGYTFREGMLLMP